MSIKYMTQSFQTHNTYIPRTNIADSDQMRPFLKEQSEQGLLCLQCILHFYETFLQVKIAVIKFESENSTFEPLHEKTCFFHVRKQRLTSAAL